MSLFSGLHVYRYRSVNVPEICQVSPRYYTARETFNNKISSCPSKAHFGVRAPGKFDDPGSRSELITRVSRQVARLKIRHATTSVKISKNTAPWDFAYQHRLPSMLNNATAALQQTRRQVRRPLPFT